MPPAAVIPRPRIDSALLRVLPSRLTPRDRYLLRMLYEHDVLTTSQVCDLGFGTRRRARVRLNDLVKLRLVDGVRRFASHGARDSLWVLDEAGAFVVAAERGLTPRDLGWRREDALRLATAGQRLEHQLGVNGFFAALIRTSRQRAGARLALWWSERRCAAEWGDFVRPDGYGVWSEDGGTVTFALEFDRGTERPADRLNYKLPGYAELMAEGARPTWLLIAFTSERHESSARAALDPVSFPVATATVAAGASPASAIWRPLEHERRLELAELASAA